jgi:hypothetical protein
VLECLAVVQDCAKSLVEKSEKGRIRRKTRKTIQIHQPLFNKQNSSSSWLIVLSNSLHQGRCRGSSRWILIGHLEPSLKTTPQSRAQDPFASHRVSHPTHLSHCLEKFRLKSSCSRRHLETRYDSLRSNATLTPSDTMAKLS